MSPTQRLDAVLAGLAEDGATGSLRVGRAGSVYLSKGRVTYVESPSSPGAEEILTCSGRVAAATLRGARQSATPDALVRQGLLTLGELQLCVLGATLDAAFFVLAATGSRPRFKEGDRHWLGDQGYFEVSCLVRECRRRRAELDRVCPHPELDSLPVVVAPRITAQRVVLTAVQWEVLVSADATATPLDLARRLGRPAYSILLAVRQLGAAGLLLDPPAAPEAVPATPPPPLPKRTARTEPGPAVREAGAARTVTPAFPQVSGDATDVGVLIRLRDALERLL
ncbi:hypothetical protein [Sphaerisporangium fuscum]|uniref:hypothetical protein n=1 Tax=Sphaerisporangium fuscum TaxID=2835868 RepID=UPI001BDD15B0|nr:hypothetical protein [Sphaerisporangium fuscum]